MSKLGALVMPALLAAAPLLGEDAPPPAIAAPTVPALTPVSIEILAPPGSKISKSGDSFPIRLAAPIVIGGKEVVPAGAPGVGEVIHAKKSGGMGTAGELVLAARYLEVDGRRLMLRSLNIAAAGQSSIHKVDAINAASAVSPLPIGLIGFFISGGQVNVAKGTIAPAKTRESFALAAPAGAAPAAAGPAAANIASKGE
jgi:hypothetical protein